MENRLKPMGAGAIFDNTFFILRDRFWRFQGVVFLSYLPAVVIGLCMLVLFLPVAAGMRGMDLFADPDSLEQLLLGVFSSLGVYFAVLCLAFLVALVLGSIYLSYGSIRLFSTGLKGEECRLREAFYGIKGKRLRYMGVVIFLILLTTVSNHLGVAVLSSIFPSELFWVQFLGSFLGVIAGFLFFLSPAVVFLEDRGVFASLRRAFTLMAGHRWRIAGTYILFYFLGYIILSVVYCIALVPVGLLVALGVTLETVIFHILAGLLGLASVLLFNLFFIYQSGPLTCIYYDLLVREEGDDLTSRPAVETPRPAAEKPAGTRTLDS